MGNCFNPHILTVTLKDLFLMIRKSIVTVLPRFNFE
jgi:hypothetical protein